MTRQGLLLFSPGRGLPMGCPRMPAMPWARQGVPLAPGGGVGFGFRLATTHTNGQCRGPRRLWQRGGRGGVLPREKAGWAPQKD